MSPSRGPNRREQILAEAQRLFAERGFREATLEDVAVTLGVKRQALYHYFSSKDEILWELTERAGALIKEATDSIFERDIPPADKLAALVEAHVRLVLTDADLFRVQFEEMGRLPGERGEALRRQQNDYVQRVASVIREGQGDDSFVGDQATSQALLIIGMCNWTLAWFDERRSTVEAVSALAARSAVGGVLNR
ncbi:TetR/AcrR family transcriptional regulator [Streptosporangium sp. NPDC051022]|uniref:TetR/AcrR family transcriptional regulator n=1 Tax=Streptosporangium sp. NPDC051022 TaxID=3155752 RepID=UPI0034481FBB